MIKVAKLNGKEFVINAELVETMESTPDTVITLTTGHKHLCKDSVDELIERIIAYRKSITNSIAVIEKRTVRDSD
ncbi:MAG: flagellar protein FlbD [Candidatus Raymondbacteria bacterium RifOxyA12_full_50_37]|uniref:Flagellar protein FlbD n=1 Tax=Candidatus Raymondbacteria bacterium RIFOXYD12_FULL_49_13 TaxID=1817890 RepID=A0A1F7F274_UNCRA|nr:MAG: flagellar protein FlbD [Candidatus Raymondbacteria bacterium RifOxyA12_full_50_37]OGJ85906.1 MAG: flagellar protein FlbD [Candidatus Raymondbacteria bacterium RIFOXYA2_FULL_49_16]OGJ95900.1 MAG: flagellar protein FlbD [Candidatus Raymondbacteria bacterium RIFOXYC2_FULL_50_21]OGJ99557.1 MAG: flagellar protein FlbD [Candidatus Raymondbacteria bacterium RifOxyC12_full_50_8]OGK00765.1 MAG: flagellar protein FlbD [Candidatus Raymondbacteria bacterium RIFOXYD12_FULL_49_13]OGP39752.1 MAG: fla